jgi:light-regulated signal transduction histidine kinase (bacteriophytochrome)
MVRDSGAVINRQRLPAVNADPEQLRILFQNLLSNALKYVEPGRLPEIRVWAARSNGHWEFFVADNGIGIDRQYWDKIFVVFQRLHPVDRYSGTGIGLAICKKIVERHGGRIRVESTPGQGSTFSFTLPVRA